MEFTRSVKRFKSIEGRFEMTWHGTKQRSFAFNGEEKQIKDTLTVMLDLETSKKIKDRTSVKDPKRIIIVKTKL